MIAGWLMLTFFHEVSPQQYPPQRRAVPAHAASRDAVTPALPHNALLSEPATGLAAALSH